MLQLLNQVANQADQTLNRLFANQYFTSALTLFLVLYAGMAAPNLPPSIARLFSNPLFRLLILFVILVLRNYSPVVSILVAIGFTLSLQVLNMYEMYDFVSGFGNLFGFGNTEGFTNEMNGGGCGCMFGGNGEEEEEESETETEVDGYDPYGFLGCNKPQPQSEDPVLPPQPDVPTQVSAVNVPGCNYQGPQGLQNPQGFPGKEVGAEYGGCGSEL